MTAILSPGTRVLPRYRGYAFDLDGTLYLGDELIPGADRVVQELRDAGSRVVFVTNKPLETSASYAAKLTRLGIPATPDDVVSAIDALVRYLRRYHPDATLLPVAEHVVTDELHSAGFETTPHPERADVVVVSFDRTFDYDKLTRAYQAVRRGAAIVATNPDPYCPTPDGGLPDCAAMLAAIEACTDTRAEAVVGKPSVHMAEAFLDRLQVPADQAAMVGDRVLTDVAMGQAAGMASVLVLSGATSAEEARSAGLDPAHVVEDVRGLLPA
ncbi:HAD-IIA family hydrolase [Streptomyces sp. NPDC001508]|uniref:HAD-IIA family hydrolase n=1 Tax=Streptomyces sp. NPDC001508 TaxID=3154656 RepID=UPI003317A706